MGNVGPPMRSDFEHTLGQLLNEAAANGKHVVDVSAKELHERTGGYPAASHRMPLCCAVMRSRMQPGDEIVRTPPSGQGASLQIRYRLPRASG